MLKMKMKVISVFCSFLILLAPTAAYASELGSTKLKLPGLITEINKGQHAPFSGILFSREAAAKLYASLSFTEEECKLKIDKRLELSSLRFNTELEVLKLKLQVERDTTVKLLKVKDQRIDFLEKNMLPTPWYESGEFWFAMGVVGGILITVGAGYAIGQAGK